jgi:hypothetical protein
MPVFKLGCASSYFFFFLACSTLLFDGLAALGVPLRSLFGVSGGVSVVSGHEPDLS